MDNVPSSAIMAIIAIVAACLIGAFIFTTVQSQKESGNAALTKVEGMNNQLDEADLTQYDGATVTGSQVKAAIKLLKDQQVSIQVINGTKVVQYNYQYGQNDTADSVAATKTAELKKIVKGTPGTGEIAASMDDTNGSLYTTVPTSKNNIGYITPSAQYVGTITRDANTNVICQITFQKTNV